MNDLIDRLVLLRHGELPPDDADALRARIAAEPVVAAEWARVRLALADLEALPDPIPPPELQARVLAGLAPRSRRWWPAAMVVGLAAAIALALVLRAPPAERRLVAGSELVDGRASIHAADAVVEVDGLVRIDVSPATPGVAMDLRTARDLVAGAALGAAVTVTVYQGTAQVQPGEGPPVVVTAPGHRTFGVSTPPTPTPLPTPSETPARPTDPTDELEALRVENAVLRGQLTQFEGRDLPFPAVPGFRAADAASLVAAAFPGVPVTLDCSEYPCIASLPDGGDSLARTRELRAQLEIVAPGLEIGTYTYTAEDPDGHSAALIAWYAKADEPSLGTRVEDRLEATRQAMAEGR